MTTAIVHSLRYLTHQSNPTPAAPLYTKSISLLTCTRRHIASRVKLGKLGRPKSLKTGWNPNHYNSVVEIMRLAIAITS